MIVVVSPHLDDAVLSAFDILQGNASRGTEVATLVTEPGENWSQDWAKVTGFSSGREEFESRRREDARAVSLTGAAYHHLGGASDDVPGSGHLLDRYVESKISEDRDLLLLIPAAAGGSEPPGSIARLLSRLTRRPSGAASHPDHAFVRDRMIELVHRHSIRRFGFYLEIPYVWNDSVRRLHADLEGRTGSALRRAERKVNADDKLQACEAYASQLRLILGRKPSYRKRVLSAKEQYLLTAEAAAALAH
ncbi:MAG: hypothetical protein QM696_09805 [Steroidobacteraceae bacterium]